MGQRVAGGLNKPGGDDCRVQPLDSLQSERIRGELRHILASQLFSRTDRPGRFLTFLVEHALNGEGDKVNEYLLAVEVFSRKPDFDPSSDPIVRVEASRLRRKLLEYYETEGRHSPIVIELPQRTYTPVFHDRPGSVARRISDNVLIPGLITIRPAVVAVAAMLIALTVFWAAPRGRNPESAKLTIPPGARSVLVLPFADLSPNHDEEYLCDGLAEEVAEKLSEVKGLRVVSRTTALQYKRSAQDVRTIGKQLNVALVLEGSVRKNGDRLRIAIQLINTADGYQLWSRRYDRQIRADFAIEEEIAQDIAERVSAGLDFRPGG